MKTTIRHYTLYILHFALALAFAPCANASALPFLIIADWGARPGSAGAAVQRKVATQIGRTAAEINSRFVLTLGDNFQHIGKEPVRPDNPLWKKFFEDVYTAPSLQTPWYPALGNHDYDHMDNPQSQIDYSKHSKRWRLPERYYTWTETVDPDTTVQFFILDSTPFVESRFRGPERPRPDWRAQLAWFERELAASKARWKIVAAHFPIYSAGVLVVGQLAYRDVTTMQNFIQPLLEKHGVQVYLSGHFHNFQHLKDGGPVDYFIVGSGFLKVPAGPKHRFSEFIQGDTAGFSAVIVKRDTMEIRFVDEDGKVFYKTEVEAEKRVNPSNVTKPKHNES